MCLVRSTKAYQAEESAKRRTVIEQLNDERLDINSKIEGNGCTYHHSL